MTRSCSWFCIVLAVATAVANAAPITLFNSFGPGDSFNGPPGIAVGCGAICWLDEGHTNAWSFVPSETVTLRGVTTAGWAFLNVAAVLVLGIAVDNSGVPGAPLESFSSAVTSSPAVLDFTSINQPVLYAGQTYWFTARTEDLVNQAAQIGISPLSLSGSLAYRVGDGPWIGPFQAGIPPASYPAFRVTGEAVPEAGTAALVAGGLCLLGWLLRQRPFRDPAGWR